jgi:hypothetical protein
MATNRLDTTEHLKENAIMRESLREDKEEPGIIFIGAALVPAGRWCLAGFGNAAGQETSEPEWVNEEACSSL